MQMTYDELVNKLKELGLLVKSYEILIHAGEIKSDKYISKPILCLKNEMNMIKEKIERLKSNVVITYNDDISYLEKMLEDSEEESEA